MRLISQGNIFQEYTYELTVREFLIISGLPESEETFDRIHEFEAAAVEAGDVPPLELEEGMESKLEMILDLDNFTFFLETNFNYIEEQIAVFAGVEMNEWFGAYYESTTELFEVIRHLGG